MSKMQNAKSNTPTTTNIANVAFYFLLFLLVLLPSTAHAGVTQVTQALTTSANALSNINISDGTIISRYNSLQQAMNAIDRSFDNPNAFLGPNPTLYQLNSYNQAIGTWRGAYNNTFAGFNNLDRLLGSDGSSPGILTQTTQVLGAANQALSAISGGQAALNSPGLQNALQSLTALNQTVGIIQNFGNTGLGEFNEAAIALNGIGSIIPGLGQKLAPVIQGLGAVGQLQNIFGGNGPGSLQQVFSPFSSSIPAAQGALQRLSSGLNLGGGSGIKTTAAQDTTIFGGGSDNPLTKQDMKDIEAIKGDIKIADGATNAAKNAAAEAPNKEGTEEIADKGVDTKGSASSCTEGSGKGKSGGKGVPVIEQAGALLTFTGQTERLTSQICKYIKKIEEIQKVYETKELKGSASKDATASKLAQAQLEGTREQFKQELPQMFLKSTKEKGPAVPENVLLYTNEERRRATENTLADLKDLDGGKMDERTLRKIKEEEANRYDEKARLEARIGKGDPDEELQQEKSGMGRLALRLSNPDRFISAFREGNIMAEREQRESNAVEAAVQDLYWGQGFRSDRECIQEDSTGKCRLYRTTKLGTITKQQASDLLVSSNITETLNITKDTDTARAQQASKQNPQARAFLSGSARQNSGNTLQKIFSSIAVLQQLLNGDDDNNITGSKLPIEPQAPAPAPLITFSKVDRGIADGSPFSQFSWSTTNADSCKATNGWITYGDVDPFEAGATSPNTGTTTPSLLQTTGGAPIVAGGELPTSGAAKLFHPLVLKARLSAEKAAQNRNNPVADLRGIGELVYLTDSDGKPVQFARFPLSANNIDTNDTVRLALAGAGIDIAVPARGIPPTGQALAGALAGAYLSNASIISHLAQETIITNNGADLFITTTVQPGTTIATEAKYGLTCTGPGGRTSLELMVPFRPVPFTTPIPARATDNTHPAVPIPIDPSIFEPLFRQNESLE